jgi:predicted GIY-YIG superfamily endonuclease
MVRDALILTPEELTIYRKNEYQMYTKDELQEMIRFDNLCPDNKQAMESVKRIKKELRRRHTCLR